MNTLTKSVTLSRAHLVCQRLRDAANRRMNEANRVLGQTVLTNEPNEDQVTALGEKGTEALSRVFEAVEALRAAAEIRGIIGDANATYGIGRKLAVLNGLRGTISLLQPLSTIDPLSMVELDDVHLAFQRFRESGQTAAAMAVGYVNCKAGVPVTVVKRSSLVDLLERQYKGLEQQALALADEINDSNQKKIEISIPADLAGEVGLA